MCGSAAAGPADGELPSSVTVCRISLMASRPACCASASDSSASALSPSSSDIRTAVICSMVTDKVCATRS